MTEMEIRIAAFQWIREQERWNGGMFSGKALNEGFRLGNRMITLKGQRGIWRPAGFSIPISISTSIRGPYGLDGFSDDGILNYAYYGKDPNHGDNRGLREAWRTRTPLLYFREVQGHRYQAIWPIIILEDYPAELRVRAAIDPAYAELRGAVDLGSIELSPLDVRRYAWAQTRRRLHQSAFREIVVAAYDRRCSICRLNHSELLDAAHIIPDTDERGAPVVQNGLSLCKIHHAAYDQDILGVSPDYRVHIREDILMERDGPMLKHGLQELNGSAIVLPRKAGDQPDRERLAERFERFRSA